MSMNSLWEVLENLIQLNKKIEDLRTTIASKHNISYGSQDARMVATDSIQSDLIAFGMWINAYYYIGENNIKEDGSLCEKEFLKAFGSGLNLEETEKRLFNQQALALLTGVNFRLDNLFKNILNVLNPELSNKGYYKKSKEVIDITIVNDKELSHGVLTAFANVRNSLHNNGIFKGFKGLSSSFIIKGIKYDFIHDQEISFAKISFLVDCIDEVINVLSKILLSDNVNWNLFISDEFASKQV